MGDFFGKVTSSIGKGMTTVSVKSKEAIEASKIKGQIDELQKRKREALEELGNIEYTMFLNGKFDEERIEAKCRGIAGVDDAIKHKEEELKQVHAKAQEALGKPQVIGGCVCGAEISEGTKFCGKCGQKVEAGP